MKEMTISKTVFSKAGREYEITYNPTMDICIIMDCMTSEAMEESFEDRYIFYNYVNYLHGDLDSLSSDDKVLNDYINQYESKLVIKGIDLETNKEFEINLEL